ncbi:ArsR/SmtB family transcription factor [Pseudorhodoplanes sp.]|uniref:ArsR/SmtB family transcription factor n=1 Tax=Pseudorhodoplanes sp. TaxID=1934341 RepID=UPI003D0C0DBF
MAVPAAVMQRLEQRAGEAAQLMKLLANETRLLILCRLVTAREMSAGAIVAAVGVGQSAVSQHLAKLRDDNLVATRRDGQTIYYRIADENVARIISVLKDIYCRDE